MAVDIHPGRETPTFTITGHPDRFIELIRRKGQLARVVRGRRCPCSGKFGKPSIDCTLCRGDGFAFDFQRELLNVDEDVRVSIDGRTVFPFRVPLIEPVYVRRLISSVQGGTKDYPVESWDSFSIRLAGGEDMPRDWQLMQATYKFDRFDFVPDDPVIVHPDGMMETTHTRFEDDRIGNFQGIHADIVKLHSVRNTNSGYMYSECTFHHNTITPAPGEPVPVSGVMRVSYFKVDPTRVLNMDLDTEEKKEKFGTQMSSGMCRFALEPWYDLGAGDLITIYSSEFERDEVVAKTDSDSDRLLEFFVVRTASNIIDENGVHYTRGTHFTLRHNGSIYWSNETRPALGVHFTVRYAYNPTYAIFMGNPIPNNLELKRYPIIVYARLYNRSSTYEQIMQAPVSAEIDSHTDRLTGWNNA